MLSSFVVRHVTGPGLSMHDVEADEDLLRDLTAQTDVRDLRTAEMHCDTSRAAMLRLSSERDGALRKVKTRRRFLFVARYGFFPVMDAVIVASAVAIACALISIFTFHAGLSVIVAILLCSYGIVGPYWLWKFHDRIDEKPERLRIRTADLATAEREAANLGMMASVAAKRFESALRVRDRVREAVGMTLARRQKEQLDTFFAGNGPGFNHQGVLDPLHTASVAGLSGSQFEALLASLFQRHGLVVTPVGGSGDQGVDIIVTGGGVRWAVQAKCYNGSVGNDSVQQAFAGMHFHKCQRCAVVTNSYFTRSARELATRVGCALVDGDQLLPALRTMCR